MPSALEADFKGDLDQRRIRLGEKMFGTFQPKLSVDECRRHLGPFHARTSIEASDVDLAIRYGTGTWLDGQAELLFEDEVFRFAALIIYSRPTRSAHRKILLVIP